MTANISVSNGIATMNKRSSVIDMPEEIDFSNSIPNPYVGKARQRITINIDSDTVNYFKNESMHTGVPYQTLMNLYLGQCVQDKKHLQFT
jgi:predicted DNA binding CopG/RHH family protein